MRPKRSLPVPEVVHPVNVSGSQRAQAEHRRGEHPEGSDRHRPPGNGPDRMPTAAHRASADS
jgi:hypothetical protein